MDRKVLSLFACGLLLAGGDALAAPSSNVAWTTGTRAKLMAADVAEGQKVYEAENCAKCHGDDGTADRDYPHLGGLGIAYAYKQLRDYKDEKRDNRRMNRAVAELEEKDLVNLAAWVATFPPPPMREPESTGLVQIDPAAAGPLVKYGSGTRLIPSCNVCHGAESRRTPSSMPVGAPRLDGQKQAYFIETMLAYKDGDRANDVYGVMRWIARALTEKEIEQLAAWYASRGARQMQADAGP